MINPTKNDVGRSVIYKPGRGHVEEGVITSFNDYAVFVRYGSDKQSKGTYRKDLTWVSESYIGSDQETEDERYL